MPPIKSKIGRFIKNKSLTAVNLFIDLINKARFKFEIKDHNNYNSLYLKVGQGRANQLGYDFFKCAYSENKKEYLECQVKKSG